MARVNPVVVIDARPRGPDGPWAVQSILGRPVLAHLIEAVGRPASIVAHDDDRHAVRSATSREPIAWCDAPSVGRVVLRADRLYEPRALRSALRRGRDPETSAFWRLDLAPDPVAAGAELARRLWYQPLGRYWGGPLARRLARALVATPVRPNALTLAAGAIMFAAAAIVATGAAGIAVQCITALLLAVALVLDTADGHLARLQNTASELGRRLDAALDELADLFLHVAIAWSSYRVTGRVEWLGMGLIYALGRAVFDAARRVADARDGCGQPESHAPPDRAKALRRLVRLAGHADVRWHLWIILAALGRLDWALLAYAAYYPARTVVLSFSRVARHD
jgi:phosphatidylglycerophosphate synthase